VAPPPELAEDPGTGPVPAGDWGQSRAFVAAPNPVVAPTPGQDVDVGSVNLEKFAMLRDLLAADPARGLYYKTFTEFRKKLECLSLASLSSLVYCL
jgi:hypothetical protein